MSPERTYPFLKTLGCERVPAAHNRRRREVEHCRQPLVDELSRSPRSRRAQTPRQQNARTRVWSNSLPQALSASPAWMPSPFHLHASLRRRGARPAQDFLYAQQGRGQRAGGRDRPATRREGSAYGDAKAWQARSRATSVTEITGPRCLVAWEAGRLCRPRTVAGGFGNPLRVPMSTTACRRQKRPNHDTRIRLASQKTDLIAQRTRHHPTTMLACSLQGPGV